MTSLRACIFLLRFLFLPESEYIMAELKTEWKLDIGGADGLGPREGLTLGVLAASGPGRD